MGTKKPHPKVRLRQLLFVRHVAINFACKVKCRQVAIRCDRKLLFTVQAMLAGVRVLPDNFDAGDVGAERIHDALL